MPELTITICQSLRIWPLDAFSEYKLCKKEDRKCIILHGIAKILYNGSRTCTLKDAVHGYGTIFLFIISMEKRQILQEGPKGSIAQQVIMTNCT